MRRNMITHHRSAAERKEGHFLYGIRIVALSFVVRHFGIHFGNCVGACGEFFDFALQVPELKIDGCQKRSIEPLGLRQRAH
jgi:hypothetical protein